MKTLINRHRLHVNIVLWLWILGSLVMNVRADDIPVADNSQAALLAALAQVDENGDRVILSAGTTTLTSTIDLNIAFNYSIVGDGSSIVQSASGLPAFNHSVGSPSLQQVIISGNNSGAGIVSTGGTLILDTVTIQQTTSTTTAASLDVSGAANLVINEATFETGTSSFGAVRINTSGSTTLNNIQAFQNVAIGGGLGAFNISTPSTERLIQRSTFSGNRADSGNLFLQAGTYELINVTLGGATNGTHGIVVGASASADLNFVTVANNSGTGIFNNGGTVNAKSVINSGNGNGCTGSISIAGRNFFQSGCTLVPVSGGTNIDIIPNITANNAARPRFFSLASSSPAIDRASNCVTFDGARTVGTDINGSFRPQKSGCDVGSFELAGSVALTPKISASPASVTLTEGGAGSTVRFSANIYPVTPLTVNLSTPDGECTVSPTSIILDSINYFGATSTDVIVSAVDDSDQEGNHTCTVQTSLSVDSSDLAYASINSNSGVDDIQASITDNDLEPNPTLNADFSAFNAPLMAEGDTARNIRFTLSAPPASNIPVSVTVDASTSAQCQVLTGSLTFNINNWSTGVFAPVLATPDSLNETAPTDCIINYSYTPASGLQSFSNTISLGADPAQQILVNPQTLTLSEGSTGTVTISAFRPIPFGSTEQYIISLTVTPATSPPQCLLFVGGVSVTSITLRDTQNAVAVDVFANPDGIPEPQHSCTIITQTVSGSTATLTVPDPVITIDADSIANPNLIVSDNNGNTVGTANDSTPVTLSDTVVEGGSPSRISVALESVPQSTQVFTVTEIGGQCTPEDSAGNVLSSISLGSTADFELFVRAIDDVIEEADPQTCTVRLSKGGNTWVQFTVTIIDNDGYRIYTLPNISSSSPITVFEGTPRAVVYGITTNPGSDAVIAFDIPSGCSLQDTSGNVISSITLTNAEKEIVIRVVVPNNGVIEPNRACVIPARLVSVPTNYVGRVSDLDLFVPDIFVDVRDANSDIAPTATPQVSATSAVVLVPTFTPAPTLVPTPVPVPRVYLQDDVRQAPVRTGPYLGASLVTLAIPQTTTNPDGTTSTTGYRVFARNADEGAGIVWYFVEVNGYRGWMSGGAVDLDANGDGTPEISGQESGTEAEPIPVDGLPTRGSIFDEIDGAPDVGVGALIVRERTIHRRPSRRAQVIGILAPNTPVSVIGRTREITYDDWYQIRWAGGVGWVESEAQSADPAVIVNPELARDRVPVR